MQINLQEEINNILADKDKVQYTISQMVALMNDTDLKVEAMKSQKWYQRMVKTVFGKNKATKEEIASKHDELNAYMAEVLAELFKRNTFTEEQLVSLGSQINQIYENIPEIKDIIYDSVKLLNDKITSLDSYVVLMQKITVGNYSEKEVICALFDVVSRIDNRVAANDEKTHLISQMLATKLNFKESKSLLEYLRGIFALSADEYEKLYSNAVSIGSGSIWVRLIMQTVEQYHFLPAAEKKAIAIDTVLENIWRSNAIKAETEYNLSEIFDDLLTEKKNQAMSTELSPVQFDKKLNHNANNEEPPSEEKPNEERADTNRTCFETNYQLAIDGNPEAQYQVGLYFHNSGDVHAAVKWYQLAANQGYADAQNDLGVCYNFGDDIEENADLASEWFRRAAEQGHAKAQFNLAINYLSAHGVKEDNAEAFSLFSKAAKQGYAPAQYYLGLCYLKAWGTDKDQAEGAIWLHQAANQGDCDAQYELGLCFGTGNGVGKDIAEAISWFKRAADQNHGDAQYALGLSYACGMGIEKNPVEAAYWYKRAAENNNPDAMLRLGICYMHGVNDLVYKSAGVIKDLSLARKYLSESIDFGESNGFADEEDLAHAHFYLAEVIYAQNIRDHISLNALDIANCIPGINLISFSLTGVLSVGERAKLRKFLTTETGREMMYHCKVAAELGESNAKKMLKKLQNSL